MSSDGESQRHVILYGKPQCPLCDEARALLDACAAEPERYVPFDLDEIDIRRDPELFARYRYRIPVIMLDGEIIAEGNMHDGDSAVALTQALAYPARGVGHES